MECWPLCVICFFIWRRVFLGEILRLDSILIVRWRPCGPTALFVVVFSFKICSFVFEILQLVLRPGRGD